MTETCETCTNPEICEHCDGDGAPGCSCEGGYIVPTHCCDCGQNEYQCVCCPGRHPDVGTCDCALTVTRADGTTFIV
ncbi:hypothetical protein B4N89_27460 [Embleya scabrispora]|uniref:Uncharacterized protein n=1 Tax=Embleya scabrispora TaxID=159449 RepID=A0A1T3P506_9ACTN|nr:hypothetical protein [Embleya scabrispora]OPC84166.1 hypothetical protein B4N89_27460 [Embleya scabrispora]